MKVLRRLLSLALIVAAMVGGWQFAYENGEPVTVNYLAGEFEAVALWVVLLASFAMGAGVVAIYALFDRARAGMIARRYRKTVAALEAEVHQLRNLPLSPEAPTDTKPLEPIAGSTDPSA